MAFVLFHRSPTLSIHSCWFCAWAYLGVSGFKPPKRIHSCYKSLKVQRHLPKVNGNPPNPKFPQIFFCLHSSSFAYHLLCLPFPLCVYLFSPCLRNLLVCHIFLLSLCLFSSVTIAHPS